MIISHKYRYLFIQLEKTASSAIAKELCENYDGHEILWKHARYEDFMKTASPEEKKYFIFSGIRNPLDKSTSPFYLYRNRKGLGTKGNRKKAMYVWRNNANFEMYFKKFIGKRIYQDWKTKNFEKLNFVYRYENLQQDFSKILGLLRIYQKRPLPVYNKTEGKIRDFEKEYVPNIQGRAKVVFSRFMKKWGYKFPEDWREPSLKDRLIEPLLLARYMIEYCVRSIADDPHFYKKFHQVKVKRKFEKPGKIGV